jgi:predicted ArsR family transcriptional regulator
MLDEKDEKILELLKGNVRMSYQELGDALGLSRVAAKKRVQKLEAAGIIRGYNTCIYRGDEVRASSMWRLPRRNLTRCCATFPRGQNMCARSSAFISGIIF